MMYRVVPIAVCILALIYWSHALPVSTTRDLNFAFDFEQTTVLSKPTTTIDYDLADFDEFGNDPGIYDVAGSPDAINLADDIDQGFVSKLDYDTGQSLFEYRFTVTPSVSRSPIKSGGISDEITENSRPGNEGGPSDEGINSYSKNRQVASINSADNNTNYNQYEQIRQNYVNENEDDTLIGSGNQRKQSQQETFSKSDAKVSPKQNVNDKAEDNNFIKLNDQSGRGTEVNYSSDYTEKITNSNRDMGKDQNDGFGSYNPETYTTNNDGELVNDVVELADLQNVSGQNIGQGMKGSLANQEMLSDYDNDDIEKNTSIYSGTSNSLKSSETALQSPDKKWSQRASDDEISSRLASDENISKATSDENRSHATSAESGLQSTSAESGLQSTSAESGSQSTSAESGSQSTSAESGSQSTSAEKGSQSSSDENGPETTSDENRSRATSDENGTQSYLIENGSQINSGENWSSTDENWSQATSDENDLQTTSHENGSQSSSDENGSTATTDENGSQSTSDENGSRATSDENRSQLTLDGNGSQSTSDEIGSQSTSDENGSESTLGENGSQSYSDEKGSQSTADQNGSRATSDENGSLSHKNEIHSFSLDYDNDFDDDIHNLASGQSQVSIIDNRAVNDNSKELSSGPSFDLSMCFSSSDEDYKYCPLIRSLYSICSTHFKKECGLSDIEPISNMGAVSTKFKSSSLPDSSASGESFEDMYSSSFDSVASGEHLGSSRRTSSMSVDTIENLSASFERSQSIFDIINIIRESCGSICALSENDKIADTKQSVKEANGDIDRDEESSESLDGEYDFNEVDTEAVVDSDEVLDDQGTNVNTSHDSNIEDVEKNANENSVSEAHFFDYSLEKHSNEQSFDDRLTSAALEESVSSTDSRGVTSFEYASYASENTSD